MIPLRTLLPFAAACALLSACDPAATIGPQPSEVAAAPTRITLEGRELTLEVHLWRDFQPITPPNGQPLVALARVKTVDGSPFPAGVTVDQVTVVYEDRVWSAPARQEHPSWRQDILEVIARDGPKWGPHVTVDVAVRVRGPGGEAYLLGAPDQVIGRTD